MAFKQHIIGFTVSFLQNQLQMDSAKNITPELVSRTFTLCLQCFDAVGWAAGRASGLKKTEWWG